AISGVVNIVTRHDGADAGVPTTADVRVSAGSSVGSYANGGVIAQDHGVSVRTGSPARSASAGISLSTLGAFVPGAQSRQVLANGSLRYVGSQMILLGTARLDGMNLNDPVSPILRPFLAVSPGATDSTPERVRQYTLGGTATFQSSERWTHALTIGVDGYRLSGVSSAPMPLPSAEDSLLRAARGAADRLTVRYSGTERFGGGTSDSASVQLTFGLENSTAREQTSGLGGNLAPRPQGSGSTPDTPGADAGAIWWSNTGLLTQAEVAASPSLLLTGGARLEHISGPSTSGRMALLPMLGATWVHEQGALTLKVRAAYGRGIRPARTVTRGGTWMGGHERASLTALDPEEQSGVEGGIDAVWGGQLGLHVTRFDQRASGLVQPVALLESAPVTGGGGPPPTGGERTRVVYQLQNVGAIDNRGWEFQGTSTLGSLTTAATLSLVSSRVARLATGYLGELHTGDRMLEVPARTMGLSATWNDARWSVSGSVARAADWVNYDKVALAAAIAADPTGQLVPTGDALRAYWRTYEGTTRVNANASYAVRDRTWITLSAANLLNRQLGEPDNVTVVPGRTVRLGVRNTF
ncbi:MAG: TonB-dependent receptor, partial [Gemmatimonadota bacterium]|nr:TonB-dependent receptor [Gemmatimonadota bacterium]